MVPSKTWFPGTLAERAAWFLNFAKQFAEVALGLGFTAADVTAVEADNAMFQFLAATQTAVDAYVDAIRSSRRVLTQGDVGDPTPAFPADLTFTPPAAVETGIFERLDFLVRRVRITPKYTDEIGALLDIIPSTGPAAPTSDGRPVLIPDVEPNNFVQVSFVKGKTGGIYLEHGIDKADFTSAGRFVRAPAGVSIPQNADNLPRSVRLRARYLDGNDPVGDWSDVVTVQTIP